MSFHCAPFLDLTNPLTYSLSCRCSSIVINKACVCLCTRESLFIRSHANATN